MSRTSGKKKTNDSDDTSSDQSETPSRTGLPAEDSVISSKKFTSPKSSKTYRIIRTSEKDAYDKPVKPKGKRAQS